MVDGDATTMVVRAQRALKNPVTSGALGAAVGAASMFAVSGGFRLEPTRVILLNSNNNAIFLTEAVTVSDLTLPREVITLPPLKVAGPEY